MTLRASKANQKASILSNFTPYLMMILGALIAATSVNIFMVPNQLIDGGTIGIAMILASLINPAYLSVIIIILTLPFVILAYRTLGRRFVFNMSFSLIFFALFTFLLHGAYNFHGDILEIVVFGGVTLGAGTGIIIRHGGCIDGTEITAILINKWRGFTVGQVILFCNIFIFGIAGMIYGNWDVALRSLMLYTVAYKIIDTVLVGFDEIKSVMIVSTKSEELTEKIVHQLGAGLTVMYGRGGFSGVEQEVLYVIIERLQLVELKAIVSEIDPKAFMAIENIHEIVQPQISLSEHAAH